MQAPDWPALYRFEDEVNSAAAAILTAAGLTARIARKNDTATTPRVEISTRMDGSQDHFRQVDGGTVEDPWQADLPDLWKGVLTCDVITNRTNDQTTDAHALYRATIRWQLQKREKFTEARLPYHFVCHIIEHTTSPELRDEQDQDVSAINFAFTLTIRPGAWPIVAP